jgi:signal transduction histidine kinase
VAGLLGVVVAGLAAFAWVWVGIDATRGVEERARAHAEVLRGAALDAAARLEGAERSLAERLATVARLAGERLGRERRPQREVLAEVARTENVARAFLVGADRRIAAIARHPAPLAARDGGPALAIGQEAEERAAVESVAALAPPAGEVRVEGLRANPLGSRERFGVAYGLEGGATLLLRASAEELAEMRWRFGVGPALERVQALPDVVRVGIRPPVDVPSEEGTVRAQAPFALADGVPVAVEVVLSTAREDGAVARSRQTIVVAAGLVVLVAIAALFGAAALERRHRVAREALEARREEDRRLAETGALASLFTHEISNPLWSVRLGVRLLEGTAAEEDQKVLATLRAETERMATTLESFLSLARGRRTGLESTEPEVLDRVRRRVAALAAERGVTLAFGADPAAPAARGNPAVVEQALTSLARNAVEASPRGGVVRVRWERRDGAVSVTVSDRGPGLPADRAGLTSFGRTTKPGGHGLGLALAKRFLEAEGGSLVLGDGEEGGALVEVRLPVAEGGGGA